jgi:NitT/TauT family transport system substrate-binding protein
MRIQRRVFLGGMLAAPAIVGRARAENTTIKIGALKLIHSMTPYFYQQFAPPGTKIEIITF